MLSGNLAISITCRVSLPHVKQIATWPGKESQPGSYEQAFIDRYISHSGQVSHKIVLLLLNFYYNVKGEYVTH